MKPLSKRLIIGGIILCVGAPLAGFLFQVVGVILAFNTLNENGVSSPSTLSTSIATTVVAPVAGFIIAIVAGIPLIIAGIATHCATKPSASPPPHANP